MKRVEIKFTAIANELEKLTARLERAEKRLEKKMAKAEKLGVSNWTRDDRDAWIKTIEMDNGWIVNKKDIEINGAWFELICAKSDVEDIKRSIEKTEARLAKADAEVEAYHKEIEEVEDLKKKEELRKLEFEAEVKEWKKDGITLEARYYGYTPSGKRFYIHGNSGMTIRSRHCVTLIIDGDTIFTSGEFWRAYNAIKNS